MASTGSVFSQTLQDITTTKLEELAKKRQSYEDRKEAVLADSRKQKDPVSALKTLAEGVKACFAIQAKDGRVVRGGSGHPRLEVDLRNLDRFLDQARFDPSISSTIIAQWRNTMLEHLEMQSHRYAYADLYGQLTMEWLSSAKSKTGTADRDAMDTSHDFEEVSSRRKLESRQLWEQNVFHPVQVDIMEIRLFLNEIFQTKESTKALQQFRENLGKFEASLATPNQFSQNNLRWVITGLLSSDLLTEEKRQVLRDFQGNQIILAEIGDILDMRMAALSTWSWGKEVPLEQRRQLNGTFSIYMHEDILQALFLHYIGVKWSTFLKSALKTLVKDSGILHNNENKVTVSEKHRRDWFLGKISPRPNVQQKRAWHYQAGYLLSQLLDKEIDDISMEEGDVEADFDGAVKKRRVAYPVQAQQMAMQQQAVMGQASGRTKQTARRSLRSAAPSSHMFYQKKEEVDDDDEQDFGLSDGSNEESDGIEPDLTQYKPKNSMDAKQKLLHLLSTDILINTRLTGDITCFRTQFESWNPLLPHATIKAVLEFFGVSQKWLKFFETFLQAPLRFMDDEGEPRLRRRGAPGSHTISDVFGEIVLFCLDFAVNEQSHGDFLWRLNDQLWFWGSNDSCISAWKTIERFNKVMGVSLDELKSGSVRLQMKQGSIQPADTGSVLPQGDIRWGMLFLDPKTSRFTIDRNMVSDHVEELRTQLKDKEKSIFSWVQAYSTYATVFFTSNFGKPANIYGRHHVDEMLEVHESNQRSLFASSSADVNSVVDWLKKEIERRFHIKDIPDGYLFFPVELGGLELKSPFIGSLQIRDSVTEDPSQLLDKFFEAERDAYAAAKKKFEERKPYEWRQHGGRNSMRIPENADVFPSFEEYTKYRERLNYGFNHQLVDVYDELLKAPEEQSIDFDNEGQVVNALGRLGRMGILNNIHADWWSMTPYWKWVASLYGPEMVKRFGGFRIVDPALLPMGMVMLFRSGRVQWEE